MGEQHRRRGPRILGDGLWYARQQGATHLIDVATLTARLSLGRQITTGLFGSQPWSLTSNRPRPGRRKKSGRCDVRRIQGTLKSEIADMVNSPGRRQARFTAAMSSGVSGHRPVGALDIAGTAGRRTASPGSPKAPRRDDPHDDESGRAAVLRLGLGRRRNAFNAFGV